MVLLGSNFVHAPAQGQNMTQQNSYTSENCVNNTNMTSNYLTVTCSEELTNTNKTIEDINLVTSTGWFVVTAWLERESNSTNSSSTKAMVSSSQNGGQSYSEPTSLVQDSNSSKRNLNLGISQEKVYATYEQDMGSNNHDVFLVKSEDGGQSFGSPTNISDSEADSKNSILTVDELTGKWVVTYLDTNVTSTSLYTDCGMC